MKIINKYFEQEIEPEIIRKKVRLDVTKLKSLKKSKIFFTSYISNYIKILNVAIEGKFYQYLLNDEKIINFRQNKKGNAYLITYTDRGSYLYFFKVSEDKLTVYQSSIRSIDRYNCQFYDSETQYEKYFYLESKSGLDFYLITFTETSEDIEYKGKISTPEVGSEFKNDETYYFEEEYISIESYKKECFKINRIYIKILPGFNNEMCEFSYGVFV